MMSIRRIVSWFAAVRFIAWRSGELFELLHRRYRFGAGDEPRQLEAAVGEWLHHAGFDRGGRRRIAQVRRRHVHETAALRFATTMPSAGFSAAMSDSTRLAASARSPRRTTASGWNVWFG